MTKPNGPNTVGESVTCNSTGGATKGDIAELRRLLGDDVVFLGWPLRSKGTNKPWGHITSSDMTPDYLESLVGGNIGVALGVVSGGLTAIDIDQNERVGPFLKGNPRLAETLQTHGARGRVFWLRMASSAYPQRTRKLISSSGEHCGEFRSNRHQSIIFGLHPGTGRPYQFIHKAKPLVVDFESIDWSSLTPNPPKVESKADEDDTECTEIQSHRVTDVTEAMWSQGIVIGSIEQAVRLAIPRVVHNNNEMVFNLARALLNFENHRGSKLEAAELKQSFGLWYQLTGNAGFLRPEQTRPQYWLQFLNAYKSAKVPLGAGVINLLWKAIQDGPFPPEANEFFEDRESRLVVALCRRLQLHSEPEPFYLSCRTVQALLHQKSHLWAARLLGSLCTLKIIQEVEKGNGHRASRYRYLGGTAGLGASTQPPKLVVL